MKYTALDATRFRKSDAFLAATVLAIVAMMIVPLPTALLDVLLATNLSMSVMILLVVLYVPEPLAIATFPTVLLLPGDSVTGFFAVMVICALASVVAIRMALKVDPAEAIGG